uniref:Uncharacterized protein LOC104225178 n=1 Tax=Nicotiana sylvestris TaxID=4096 RepID=A0A1U7WDC3_NICSY|nr:PREDICTED: uncharacterized protein LOC104225178 [Nicotiana sylvestris]
MACEPSVPKERVEVEGEMTEANPPQVQEAGTEVRVEATREAGSAPPDVIEISGLPSFTEFMFGEARATKGRSNEGVHRADDPLLTFFDGVDSTILEDLSRLSDLEVPRKSPSSEASGPILSTRLINQLLAPNTDSGRKRSVVITVPEDARIFFAPVGVASYLQCLVTKEDQAKMNEMDASCLFNEAQ